MISPSATEGPVNKKILSVFLISAIPFLYCYFLFFTFNQQITHSHLPTTEVLSKADTHASGLDEHDGIERNVLLAMFLIVGPAGFMLYKSGIAPKFLMGLGAVLLFVFLAEMHFFNNLLTSLFVWNKIKTWVQITLIFTAVVALWALLYNRLLLLGRLLIVQTIIICCFVPWGDISIYDYSYIMAPALKVLQCGKISAAYFQYDLLPSIPAYFILKHSGGPYDYRIAAQVSMFIFFVAAFVMARRFFVYKNLAFLLLAAIMLVRLFMGLNEITNAPQVTSMRLDWWLLLFAASYYFGLKDFKFGLCLLFLIVMLNSFGVIYLLCYLLLIGFLLLLQFYNSYISDGMLPNVQAVTDWFKAYGVNIGLAVAGVILHWLITGNMVNESVTIYKDFQLGMLPVLQDSAYWYFGAVFVFCFALLLVFKDRFKDEYWNASLFLLFLFVGNSIYFYGRSHENNIINISGSLLFVVILCSDLLLQLLAGEEGKLSVTKKLTGLAPFAFIFLIMLMADANLFAVNTKVYTKCIKDKFPDYPVAFPHPMDLQVVADITHGSKKVYFMVYGGSDFYLYYAGNYNVPSKYVPIDTWMLKSEKIEYANKLLSEGYYIVAVAGDDVFKKDFLPYLHYKNTYPENVYVAYSNE